MNIGVKGCGRVAALSVAAWLLGGSVGSPTGASGDVDNPDEQTPIELALEQCGASDDVLDQGHSVELQQSEDAVCVFEQLGIPEWAARATMVEYDVVQYQGVAVGPDWQFGDYSVTQIVHYDATVGPNMHYLIRDPEVMPTD